MVFSSKMFIFAFLPLVLLFYVLTPKKAKNYLLLAVSLFFYGFGEPSFVWVMVASILINYAFALMIHSLQNKRRDALAWLALALSVVLNIGMLFVFKYLDFFIQSTNSIFGTSMALRNIALPIGISFFTFQALSYVIDVYRNEIAVQRNPFKLGMYVAFFPQLIAGPIVRYVDIVKEIDNRSITIEGFSTGIMRFIIGLSKKVLIADIFAKSADSIFALQTNQLTAPIAWIGVLSYTIQIYFDFSGYSDMAIGLGRMFGFHFLENFNYPYISKSITEFWRRWHISLSTWFRDYLYIPLGGNRRGNVYLNLLVVFLATGTWHGANATFIVWGLWHGVFLIIERVLKQNNIKLEMIPAFIRWLVTLLIVVVGWVIFRSDSMAYALEYVKAMFGVAAVGFKPYNALHYLDRRMITGFFIAALASTSVLPWLKRRLNLSEDWREGRLPLLTYPLTLLLLLLCIIFIMNQGYSPFIYFRF